MSLHLDRMRIEMPGFSLDADLSLPPDSACAVIGPSGAGKSTLLLAIAGFVPLSAGRMLVGGRDMAALPPAERTVSMLFQEHNLFAHLSAAQNVGLGLHPGLRLDAPAQQRVREALAEVGLEGRGDALPGQLSGGQRQRVALARALIRQRPLLLLDEPFAALGPGLRHEMLDLVARIRARLGAILLMVTHNPDDAARICPLSILLAEGQASPPAPTAALLADPPPALRAYLGT